MEKRDAFASFANDIRPLFRPVDVEHMAPMGVLLDDYAYMSEHENAQRVYDFLAGNDEPRMPIGGPYWDQQQLELFSRWMKEGCKP